MITCSRMSIIIFQFFVTIDFIGNVIVPQTICPFHRCFTLISDSHLFTFVIVSTDQRLLLVQINKIKELLQCHNCFYWSLKIHILIFYHEVNYSFDILTVISDLFSRPLKPRNLKEVHVAVAHLTRTRKSKLSITLQ